MPRSSILVSLTAAAQRPGRLGSEMRSSHDSQGGEPRRGGGRCDPAPTPTSEGAGAPLRLSDEELLVRYRDARKPEDFIEIVHRFSGVLGRYLGRYLGDPALAEDALQETLLHVHTKCGLYSEEWSARAWLHAIATHCAVDVLRWARRLPKTHLDAPASENEKVDASSLLELLADAELRPLEVLEEQERQQWVRDSVSRLPESLRQVLVLAYYQDLTYAEIVTVLGIPLGTVKSRLHSAVARLRDMAERAGRP